jgi:hypothetical protein
MFGAALLGGAASLALRGIPRPKLLVLLVLEQFRVDFFNSLLPVLISGGFRRLTERGAFFPDCRHAASTFPATTIATLATGAWPAQHGIVADSWYDRAAKRVIPANEEALAATTLAAQAAAEPDSRVYVIADSAVQAGIFAGAPEARIFYLDPDGRFTVRGEAHEWLADFNTQHSPDNLRNAKWQAIGAKPDSPPLRILSYDQNHPAEFQRLYRSSYFAQAAPVTLLRECIARERLGQGAGLDFACVISSASSLLGNETGARPPLLQQMILQLDREIEGLLADLTRAMGENGFTLVVAGGHGVPPLPAATARARMAVDGESVARDVAKALQANRLGAVEKYVYPFLYLDTAGWRDPEPVRLAAARAAMENPAVANYFTAGGACSTNDDWQRRFRNSFHAKRSGDAMLSYKPEYVEDFGQGRGVSYGSLYNYDVRVPLMFYGPQFRAGVYEAPVESVDLAPTLARVMGVATPSSSSGRVLGEAILE